MEFGRKSATGEVGNAACGGLFAARAVPGALGAAQPPKAPTDAIPSVAPVSEILILVVFGFF